MSAAAFLNDLSDRELAYVFVYQRASYLPEQQDQILDEIARRNLTVESLAALVRQPVHQSRGGGCELCGTHREQIDEACVICGFIPGTIRDNRGARGFSWTKLPVVLLDVFTALPFF